MEVYDERTLAAFTFLDELRESGVTNMLGGGAYLVEEFDMSEGDARRMLTHWMNTFAERHVRGFK